MKLIKMPSIGQFRNVTHDITKQAQFRGMDGDNTVVDRNATLPTVTFTGTTKVHGTNAGVAYNGIDLWAQSKGNIITPEKDNAGFADFVNRNTDHFRNFLAGYLETNNLKEVVIYGEWAGKGIQKGVGVSELEKTFYPFGIKYLKEDVYEWVKYPKDLLRGLNNEHIKSIFDFETFEIEIDFDDSLAVKEAQNKMNDITLEVETKCPVAGGTGEGVVWTGWYNDNKHQFKVKGEKHAKSRVKVPKTFTPEEIKAQKVAIDFVQEVVTEGRLEQMLQETFDTINGGQPNTKGIGNFLKAVTGDVYKEELDRIAEKNLERKTINPLINQIAKKWFFERIK